MTQIKINTLREYELYVKARVAKMQVSNKHKAIIREVVMQAFTDGLAMTQGSLEVIVKEFS